MNIPGLLLRLLLLVSLVLNAPVLARATAGIPGQPGADHCVTLQETCTHAATATPDGCVDTAAGLCDGEACDCSTASVAALLRSRDAGASPGQDRPGRVASRGHPSPALSPLIRPPIA